MALKPGFHILFRFISLPEAGNLQIDRLTPGTGRPLRRRSGTRRWSSPTTGCGSRTCACLMPKRPWGRCRWPAWSPGGTPRTAHSSRSVTVHLRSERPWWVAWVWMWQRGEGVSEAAPLGWSVGPRRVEEAG